MRKIILLLFLLLLPISCLERNFEQLKEIPTYKESESEKKLTRQDFGRHFAYSKSFNWKDTKIPKDIGFIMLDAIYKPVDYYFFKKFNNWFDELLFHNGIMSLGEKKQNLDCDNFAMLYKSLFGVASYSNKFDIEFAVGVVVVEQVNEFGGIPSGYLHMLNIVFTNRDWYIFEPQTGVYIELHKYVNQEHIKYIII